MGGMVLSLGFDSSSFHQLAQTRVHLDDRPNVRLREEALRRFAPLSVKAENVIATQAGFARACQRHKRSPLPSVEQHGLYGFAVLGDGSIQSSCVKKHNGL